MGSNSRPEDSPNRSRHIRSAGSLRANSAASGTAHGDQRTEVEGQGHHRVVAGESQIGVSGSNQCVDKRVAMGDLALDLHHPGLSARVEQALHKGIKGRAALVSDLIHPGTVRRLSPS